MYVKVELRITITDEEHGDVDVSTTSQRYHGGSRILEGATVAIESATETVLQAVVGIYGDPDA